MIGNFSSFVVVVYDVFNNIWVIVIYKYGMCKDVKMKLYVVIGGGFVFGRVSFWYSLVGV